MTGLLACSAAEAPLVAAPQVWVERPKVGEGEALLLHAPPGTVMPTIAGLTFTPATELGSWEVHGSKGSYIVDVPLESSSATLYVDIGVEGPSSELEDIATLPPPPPSILPWILLGVAAVLALLVGARLLWRRYAPPPALPPVEAPEITARREWGLLRARSDLAPDTLAAELSGVFRRYLEAIHEWPATTRTSREILDALAGDLPAMQLERARRLLFAMDIVRFSERSTHADFFSSLDDDFGALLTLRGRRRGA